MTALINKPAAAGRVAGLSQSRDSVAIPYLLILYIALSAISVFTHNVIIDRPFHDQQVELHRQVIANEAPAPIQYRIFVYYIAEGLIRAGLDFNLAYSLIRFAFLFGCALMLHLFMRKWLDDAACLAGTLFMFAVMPLTYWGYYMQVTDTVNLFFFIAAFRLIRARKDMWLAPLLFVAMFNREAPIILPLVFLFYRYDEIPLKELAGKFILFCFAAGIVYFGLPKIMGVRPAYEEIFVFAKNIGDYHSFVFPALLLSVFLILPWKNFSKQPKFLRRGALMLPFFLVLHYLITLPRETRLFLPLFPILIPMGLITLFGARQEEPQTPATTTLSGALQPHIIKRPLLSYIVLFLLFLGAFRLYYVYMEKTYMKDFYKNREIALLLKEGDSLMKKGDYAGAVSALEQVIARDPGNESASLSLGIIYDYNIKDPAKAVFYFSRLLEINPNTPQSAKIKSEITRLRNK